MSHMVSLADTLQRTPACALARSNPVPGEPKAVATATFRKLADTLCFSLLCSTTYTLNS